VVGNENRIRVPSYRLYTLNPCRGHKEVNFTFIVVFCMGFVHT